MNKLVLGSAQFGMDYGVNNGRGKIPRMEVFEILREAVNHGIDTVDTAASYGDSEKVLGEFTVSEGRDLKIVSKLTAGDRLDVKSALNGSLDKLRAEKIFGYLIHNFESYKKNEKIWDEMKSVKDEGKVEKIGFSLYYPDELEYVFKKGLEVDIIQIPFSVFDQRFDSYLPRLKKIGAEIYARSIFLQGLVFKNTEKLGKNFEPVKGKIKELNLIAEESGISVFSLCVSFVSSQRLIDKIIVGVDSLGNFMEIIKESGRGRIGGDLMKRLRGLEVGNEEVLLPFNWRLAGDEA